MLISKTASQKHFLYSSHLLKTCGFMSHHLLFSGKKNICAYIRKGNVIKPFHLKPRKDSESSLDSGRNKYRPLHTLDFLYMLAIMYFGVNFWHVYHQCILELQVIPLTMYKLFSMLQQKSHHYRKTVQIRLHFTALVIPILLPIEHVNILYTDKAENPRERGIKNNKTMKTLQYSERDERLTCWGKK